MQPLYLRTLQDLVASFGARGDKQALVAFGADSSETLSFDALGARIADIAGGLTERGIRPGDLVLLCGPNGPGWAAAYFGIVAAGATAVPVDDQSGPETLIGVLRHSGARFAFTSRRHLDALGDVPERPQAFALLEAGAEDPLAYSRIKADGPVELPAPDPARIASLVYTSGTTGNPKAVPLTHANLAADANALMRAGLIGASDRVLLPLPMHHSYPFTVGLLLVLGMGATLVLPSGMSGPEITGALKAGDATAMLGVPSLYAAVWQGITTRVEAGGGRQARLFRRLLAVSRRTTRLTGLRPGKLLFRPLHANLGKRLRILGCGGAKLDPQLARDLETLGWTVLSGYGLTETSPVLTFNSRRGRRLDSEGRALPGVEIRIAEASDPAQGEILARGPNVFAGYWNNPDATREAFTADGWFRTGDLGWLDAEGYLHVAGRLKEVIVLAGGKNVFPEDVEPTYGASPLLREIALLEREGRLVALAVPDEDELRRRGGLGAVRLIGDELERLGMQLPPYERLMDFRAVREPLPRTRLGKLRRHLLLDLYERAGQRSLEEQPVDLSAEDKQLVEASPTTQGVWQWLAERYPDRHLYLDMSPQLDLQIDSLGWVTLTLELEQRFRVALSGAAVSRVLTLRDLLTEVHRAEQSGATTPAAGGPRPAPPRPGPVLGALGAGLFALDRALMRTLFSLSVTGQERVPSEGPLVFAPNHESFLDPAAIAAALPPGMLRRVHWAGWVGVMFAGPVSRLVSRATGVFPVDPDQDLAGAIGTARAVLEQGDSLVWFPEGRRSLDGRLLPFRPGIGALLEHQTCRVVPTFVQGSFEAWPPTRKLPRRHPVSIAFGPSASVAELAAEGEGDSEPARIRSALERRVQALAAQFGAPPESPDSTKLGPAR